MSSPQIYEGAKCMHCVKEKAKRSSINVKSKMNKQQKTK